MALGDHTNLIAHWKLNEASGARVDSHGSNDLSDNNTVGQRAGVIGDAASFVRASDEFLNIVDNVDVSTGDIDYTFHGWFRLDDLTDSYLMAKWNSAGTAEYALQYDAGGARFIWRIGKPSVWVASVVANNLGAPSINTWYFIVMWHDATANKAYIQVNNGTVDEAAESSAPADNVSDFRVGALISGASQMDGAIDSLSLWKRVLTATERTDLYNGGAGLDYPFTVAAGNPWNAYAQMQ